MKVWALAAVREGRFADEIAAVTVKTRKGEVVVASGELGAGSAGARELPGDTAVWLR